MNILLKSVLLFGFALESASSGGSTSSWRMLSPSSMAGGVVSRLTNTSGNSSGAPMVAARASWHAVVLVVVMSWVRRPSSEIWIFFFGVAIRPRMAEVILIQPRKQCLNCLENNNWRRPPCISGGNSQFETSSNIADMSAWICRPRTSRGGSICSWGCCCLCT